MKIDFYNGKDDLMNFKLAITPRDGLYYGGTFTFDFKVPSTYPHDAPKVLCLTPVYHPNIDMEGHVCLNILREDWKPVLTISSVFLGLEYLFIEPNPDDPLNKEAAEKLASDKRGFSNAVTRSLRGETLRVGGKDYRFEKFVH